MATRVLIPGRANGSNIGTGGGSIASPNYPNTAQEQGRHMVLRSRSAGEVTLLYSPRETSHSGLALQWEEIPRSNQDPLIVNGNNTAETMGFECTVARTQPDNIVRDLMALKKMARSKDPITISYTDWEGAGYWRIRSMSVDIVHRSSIDHSPTFARVSIEFISLPGTSTASGMLTGGTGTGSTAGLTSAVRTHVVSTGDTLWSIAQKYYGDGEQWTVIASANGLTKPRTQLAAGRPGTLKIPSLA